jgi:uncharacterized protein
MPVSVVRPLVRSYSNRERASASAHVRAGGHAILWMTAKRAMLVVPFFDDDDIAAFGWWSILDLRKQRYRVIREGVLKGLIETLVPRDCHRIVRERIQRDVAHPGAVRRITLDCLKCGACCLSNEVILDEDDIARFEAANRQDLTRPPYTRRNGHGEVVLRLQADGACRHKQVDHRCAIYEIRPGMCREFPVGSECCLSARADELGIWDRGEAGGET